MGDNCSGLWQEIVAIFGSFIQACRTLPV